MSHDRAFLDNVVTSTLVFEGEGRVAEYVGGYSDWLRQRPEPPQAEAPETREAAAAPARPRQRSRKLGYREQRELEALPGRIEALEAELAEVQRQLDDPGIYAELGSEGLARLGERMKQLEAELEAAYDRWAELEA